MSSNSQKLNKSPQSTNKPTSTKASRKPYNDWIHCNACYEQYMRKRRTFYLLACEHITCQQCTKEIHNSLVNGPKIFTCSLCRLQTRACKMGNDMPSHLKELFHPEPYLDGLNTYRIILFQTKHRRRFLEWLERQYAINQEYKEVSKKDREEAKKCYQNLEELKIERKRLEKRVVAIKNQRKAVEENRVSLQTNGTNSLLLSQIRPLVARSTVSASTSNSSGPRMANPISAAIGGPGVKLFAPHSTNNSFVL